MQIDCIVRFSDLILIRREWDLLFTSSRQQHPFLSFTWVCNWWQHMLPVSRITTNQLYILLIKKDDGQLAGIAPFFKTSYFGTNGIRYIRPIGSDPNLTEIKPVICIPGLEADILKMIEGHLKAHTKEWEFCQWLDVPLSVANFITMKKLPSRSVLCSYILDLGTNFSEFRSTRKRNVKESIRKCYNKAKRENVEFSFVSTGNLDEIRQNLPTFFELHTMRAYSTTNIEHADYFRLAKHRTFLESILTVDSVVKSRLFLLKHEENSIAARFGFESNGVLYLYFSGYNSKYAEYSVTTRLLVEVMKDAITRGIHLINLSTGLDVSKTRWSPEEHHFIRPLVVSDNFKARISSRIFYLLKKLRYKLWKNPIKGRRKMFSI